MMITITYLWYVAKGSCPLSHLPHVAAKSNYLPPPLSMLKRPLPFQISHAEFLHIILKLSHQTNLS